MPDEYGLQITGLIANSGYSADDVDSVCLASVVPPLTGRIVETCRNYLKQEPLVVDTGVKTGVRVRYDDPRAVGADRIVDARLRNIGRPACVVDFGTATTPMPSAAVIRQVAIAGYRLLLAFALRTAKCYR
jgi:type III pantothenate kinase